MYLLDVAGIELPQETVYLLCLALVVWVVGKLKKWMP